MLRVFYIDDEPFLCEMFAENFSSETIEVKTFTDPEEALLALADKPPHMVFIDYRLVNTTGPKVAQRMDPSIPKALVTGDLDVDSANQFVKVFHKPFDFDRIEEFLDYGLKNLQS